MQKNNNNNPPSLKPPPSLPPLYLDQVELRVLEQMRQRELTHEMRNLSRKLTPAERKVATNSILLVYFQETPCLFPIYMSSNPILRILILLFNHTNLLLILLSTIN